MAPADDLVDFHKSAAAMTAARDVTAEFRAMARRMVMMPEAYLRRLDAAGSGYTNVPAFDGNASGAYAVAISTTGASAPDFFGVAKPRHATSRILGNAEGLTVECLVEKVVSDVASAAGFTSIIPAILVESEDRTGLKLVTPICAWPVGTLDQVTHQAFRRAFELNPRAWAEMAVIDALFMNFDRTLGRNILHYEDNAGDLRLMGIDHGLAAGKPIGREFSLSLYDLRNKPEHAAHLARAIRSMLALGEDGIGKLIDRLPAAYTTDTFRRAFKRYAATSLDTLAARISAEFDDAHFPEIDAPHEELRAARRDAAKALRVANVLRNTEEALPPAAPLIDDGRHALPAGGGLREPPRVVPREIPVVTVQMPVTWPELEESPAAASAFAPGRGYTLNGLRDYHDFNRREAMAADAAAARKDAPRIAAEAVTDGNAYLKLIRQRMRDETPPYKPESPLKRLARALKIT